jgi:hypothetical protein
MVGLELLQHQVGTERPCMKVSLSEEKVRTPLTEDNDLMVIENYEGEMGEYSS